MSECDLSTSFVNISLGDPGLAPLRAAYFQRVRNIGDAVAPYILQDVTGRPTVLTRSRDVPHLLSIGSFVHTSTRQSFLWGTGLIHPSVGVGDPNPDRILAVRGKLTYAELLRSGVAVGDLPLGDPGVLIARLVRPEQPVAPRFPLGLVPHYVDRDHPFFVAAAKDPEVKVLDVCAPAEIFLAELGSCEAVASSSLHGLVFAEGLGLPTLWLEVSNNVVGDRFKFADWFSLARNPQPAPVCPPAFVSVAEIQSRCEPREVDIDVTALLEALTPNAVEACSEDPLSRSMMVPVSVCRRRPLPVFVVSDSGAARQAEMILWLRRQTRAVEIVVCCPSAREPGLMPLLSELERQGVATHTLVSEDGCVDTDRLNETVTQFFEDWAEPSRYAVTGCTDDLDHLSARAIDLYDDLLDRFPRADSIGPDAGSFYSDEPPVELFVNGREAQPERATAADVLRPRRCLLVKGGFDLGFAVHRAAIPLVRTITRLRVRDDH